MKTTNLDLADPTTTSETEAPSLSGRGSVAGQKDLLDRVRAWRRGPQIYGGPNGLLQLMEDVESFLSIARGAAFLAEAWRPTHRHETTGVAYRVLGIATVYPLGEAATVYEDATGRLFAQEPARFAQAARPILAVFSHTEVGP